MRFSKRRGVGTLGRLGFLVFVLGISVAGVGAISGSALNTAANLSNIQIGASSGGNVQSVPLSFTFNNVGANCGGTWGCEVQIQANYCVVYAPDATSCPFGDLHGLIEPYSAFTCSPSSACTSAASSSGGPLPLAHILQGSSVDISTTLSLPNEPTYYLVLSAIDSSFNQIACYGWACSGASGTTGTFYPSGSTGWTLTVKSTGYDAQGCTTNPVAGSYLEGSGSTATISAVNSCPVNAGTATFSYWSVVQGGVSQTSNVNPLQEAMKADTTVTPVYSCDPGCSTVTPTFSVIPAPGQGVMASPSSLQSLNYGGSVTFTFTAASGYSLTGWTGWQVIGCKVTSPISGSSTSVSLTYAQLTACGTGTTAFYVNTGNAVSLPKLTISVTTATGTIATAGGSTNPAPGIYTEAQSQQVTVTAIANTGYKFQEWFVDGVASGSSPSITVTMDKDHLVVAAFTDSHIQVYIGSAAGITTTPPFGPQSVLPGANFSVSEVAASGYKFQGWFVNGSMTAASTSSSYSFRVDGNTVITPISTTSGGGGGGGGGGAGACVLNPSTNAAVTVLVIDADNGSLIKGATVNGGGVSATSDSSGSATLCNIQVPGASLLNGESGSIQVTSSAPGFKPLTQTVTVTQGQFTSLTAGLSPAGGSLNVSGGDLQFAGIGIAAVGAVMVGADFAGKKRP